MSSWKPPETAGIGGRLALNWRAASTYGDSRGTITRADGGECARSPNLVTQDEAEVEVEAECA
jgi:hypothetical protein